MADTLDARAVVSDRAGGRRPLPSGTVTFLLTDVQGSTHLWEQRRPEMTVAIAEHYRILDEVIAAFDGVRPEEQGEGDSVVGAFALASSAVGAAAEAQRRLMAEVPLLAVRMAVHTGEAQLRDERNYVGRSIIRCARLRACGHGGQVLVSAATTGLVADDLPVGVELVDLGQVRLRDLGAEQVYQLAAEGLRPSFPPLRALDAPRTNVPVPATTFVGRDDELATVVAMVRADRLVTLTGSGGCGKSRLAVHTAGELAAHHTGGTWWVDLASINDGADVVEALIRAAGGNAPPGADAEAAVRAVGELGPTLLVVDNAEHVLQPTADLVAAVLARCPDARVLVTSREPLGIDGEVVWRVPSLRVPPTGEVLTLDSVACHDAAALFLDRARRARPNISLGDAEAVLIASICTRLDGLPLALELAAARIRTMPLERVASGLDDAFRLLTGGSRTAMARQQTLIASIAWSVDLLHDDERAVLRRLAVFQSAFTLEAAEVVTADGDVIHPYDVLDVLSRLVDKSLVQLDDATGRYRLLETIRQFGIEQLRDARELPVVRARHAEWFTTWCEAVGRGECDFDVDDQHPNLPDLFAALAWAYDMSPETVCRISGATAQVRDYLGRYHDLGRQAEWFAAHLDEPDAMSWARGATGLAWMAVNGAAEATVFELLERAHGLLATAPDDTWPLPWFPSVAAAFNGEAGALAEVLRAAERAGDDQAVRRLIVAHMVVEVTAGRLDAGLRAAEIIAELHARHGLSCDARTAAAAIGARIHGAGRRGDLAAALELVRDGIRTRPGTGGERVSFTSTSADMASAAGDRPTLLAVIDWQRSIEAELDVVAGPDRPGTRCPTEYARGLEALLDGRVDDALHHLRRAQRTTPFCLGLTNYVTLPLVHVLLGVGERGEAEDLVTAMSADVARLVDVPQPEADLHLMHAWLARADGDLDRAMSHAHLSLRAAWAAGLRLSTVDAMHLVAMLAHERGNVRTAIRLLGAVRAEQRRIGMILRYDADPDATDGLEALAATQHVDAWQEGASLALGDAVELAGRARGERNRPMSGWASLTPTEERVATLVASGRSNGEIASQLLMSVPTVKTHLTRAFAKLGVTNRTELAARFGRSADR